MGHSFLPELRELVSKIGLFAQHCGFKEIHGRIWSYVFLAKEPVDSTTLVRRLNVSKALVSLALKDLRKTEMILTADKVEGRKIFFRPNPNVHKIISQVLEKREKKLVQGIQSAYQTVRALDCSTPNVDIDSKKLEELGDMIESTKLFLEFIISANCRFDYSDKNQ